MNKKVMAVAVAGVLAAPAAFAQTSNVQLYGRAVLGLDYYKAEGSNNPVNATQGVDNDRKGRLRVFDNSSRVGLRGTEDLGNGLRAIFQIETGVNIDNGNNTGQGGQNNASSGFWASRDSFVGLDSNFGRLTFGRQSIYWANGVNAQFAANYINTEIPWTNGTSMGRIHSGALGSATPARVSNVVQYTTPTFAGLNATLSYSPNFQEAVQNEGAGTDTDGRIWGATVRGEWGPFYAQVDYADVQGNSLSAPVVNPVRLDGAAWKVGASWGYLPGARIGVIWVYSEANNAVGLTTGNKVHQQGATINWEHTFGNFQVMAQFGWLDNLKGCNGDAGTVSCNDTGAMAYMVGGRYFLSKRTWLFASWNMTSNENNQFADYTGGAITSTNLPAGGGPTYPYGADPQVWAIGIFHQF
jgi:predicted porin